MAKPDREADPHRDILRSSRGRDRFLHAILETIVDAIVMIDEAGVIRHVNPSAERMFGYTASEMIGQNVSLLMPSPDRTDHLQHIAEYCRTGASRFVGQGQRMIARKKEGDFIPVDLVVSEVSLGENRFFTGVLRDATEQVRTEEQLRRERDFSDSLIETAHAIILVLDPQGNIQRFNRYMEQIGGYSLDEVAGRDWFETFIPEPRQDEVRAVYQKTLTGIPVWSHVNPIITRSGQERLIMWSGKRLMSDDDAVIGVLAVGDDITEWKEAERKLVQSERLAAIGEMVTGLAHESRNALQRSLACLEMLELDLADHPEQLELIGRAENALRELQRLYEEVRSYSAPIKLERTLCLLPMLIHKSWADARDACAERDVTMQANADPDCPPVRCDPARIHQVFRNVFENAVAVSPRGGTVTVRCEVTRLHGQPAVRTCVRDEGPGLTPEQIEKLFEPFYTTKTRGTGLGMAIVRRIVEAHHGVIKARNHPHGGAEIAVALPTGSAADAADRDQAT